MFRTILHAIEATQKNLLESKKGTTASSTYTEHENLYRVTFAQPAMKEKLHGIPKKCHSKRYQP